MWDFGSAARHHELYNPWLGDGRSRAGHLDAARRDVARVGPGGETSPRKIQVELEQRGLLDEPVGVDAIELAGAVRAAEGGHRRSSTASS